MTISKIIQYLPVVAQAKSFSELARNITNLSDPVSVSFEAIKLIISVCALPHVKYPLKCAILAAQIGVCFSTGGLSSVTSLALGIGTAK